MGHAPHRACLLVGITLVFYDKACLGLPSPGDQAVHPTYNFFAKKEVLFYIVWSEVYACTYVYRYPKRYEQVRITRSPESVIRTIRWVPQFWPKRIRLTGLLHPAPSIIGIFVIFLHHPGRKHKDRLQSNMNTQRSLHLQTPRVVQVFGDAHRVCTFIGFSQKQFLGGSQYRMIVSQYCNIIIFKQYYSIIALQYYSIIVLQYCRIIVFQHHDIVVLQYFLCPVSLGSYERVVVCAFILFRQGQGQVRGKDGAPTKQRS